MEMKPVSFYLHPDDLEEVRWWAEEQHMTVSAYIREAVLDRNFENAKRRDEIRAQANTTRHT